MIPELTPGFILAVSGAGLAVGLSAIGSGMGVGIAGATGAGVIAIKPGKFGQALVFQAVPQTQGMYGLLVAVLILLSTGVIGGVGDPVSTPMGLAALGAGLAVGLAGLSAIGQGIAASAGIATSSEDDSAMGRSLVFSVIPETQAIYGLLVAILIMAFSGILAGDAVATMATGLAAIGCGLAVGLAGLSAIGQGIAAAAGSASSAEHEGAFGRALVFSVIPETQAIYGLLVAILIMAFTGMIAGGPISDISIGIAAIGCGFAIGLAALSAIGQGIAAAAGAAATAEKPESFGRSLVFSVIPETQAIYGLLVAILIMAFTGMITRDIVPTLAAGFASIACGIAVGFAAISAIGQGIAASAGIATTSEREEMFGKGLVFSVIPETQAIYGLLVAILIMAFTGIITRDVTATAAAGLACIGSGFAVGLAGLSAIGQGMTAAAGIGAVARRPESMGQALVFAVMAETFAIFGLLVAILIMFGIGLFGGL
ncbi:MAG: ATP synthase subunit c [Methanocalculus sp. 52_23]|jgi:V/A-type H+-transporting ATPase subunit K|uniref:V-type ATP synthase subunit K n=1 Tax=Methanocalculus sp. TaxID=2004547 RepID=UPI00074A98E5|nr:V-type ATP synthase subunit K [Methanocalculus sp.]KUK69672.1 MAG: ATP synthase subunit c [Methanocalculus sp. 52_23]HIJ06373.1 V-type ATP synthase subunit K [Methanocalculus sp.]